MGVRYGNTVTGPCAFSLQVQEWTSFRWLLCVRELMHGRKNRVNRNSGENVARSTFFGIFFPGVRFGRISFGATGPPEPGFSGGSGGWRFRFGNNAICPLRVLVKPGNACNARLVGDVLCKAVLPRLLCEHPIFGRLTGKRGAQTCRRLNHT